MKRIMTLLLVASLLLTPCAAFAQGTLGGALGGLLGGNAATEEAAAPVTLYTLTEAGITIELPEEWMVLTTEPDQESIIPTLFGASKEECIDAFLTPMGGHLYAITDLISFGQLFVVSAEGMPLVDMRVDKMEMDLNTFMLGFVQGFTQSIPEEDIVACDSFTTEIAHFARILFNADDGEGGKMLNVQYCTNVNGKIYLIQYIATTPEISEETLTILDTVASGLKFIEAEAE